MKLSLSFKNSEIRYLGNGKYDVIFNIGNKILNRFSEDTRIFIESFTHCEYKSSVDNHDLVGSFEIRCDFINSLSEYDNEDSLGSIIFRDNMINYKSFVNTSPLHVYNYKLNTSSFLNGRLHFEIDFFDHKGDEFINYNSTGTKLDILDPSYATYQNDENALNNLLLKAQDLNDNLTDVQNDVLPLENLINDASLLDNVLRIDRINKIIDRLTLQANALAAGANRDLVNNTISIFAGNDQDEICRVLYKVSLNAAPYSIGSRTTANAAKNELKTTLFFNFFKEYSKLQSLKNLENNFKLSTTRYIYQNVALQDAIFKKVSDNSKVRLQFLLDVIKIDNLFNYTVNYVSSSSGVVTQATGQIELIIYNFGANLSVGNQPYDLRVIIKSITFDAGIDNDLVNNIPTNNFDLIINQNQFTFEGVTPQFGYLVINIDKTKFFNNSVNEIAQDIILAEATRDASKAQVSLVTSTVTTNLNDSIIDNLRAMSISFGIYEENIQLVGAKLQTNDYSKSLLNPCKRL